MQSKSWITIIGIFVAVVLLSGACAGGFLAGYFITPASQQTSQGAGLPVEAATPSSGDTATDTLFVPFWEAWQVVNDQYYIQPVDQELLMQGAIRGMMEALGDQHSSYMDPNQYNDATASFSGEYEGIGAWVNTEGEYLTIVEPMKGSPAEAAGLKPGDQIIAIDGEDMTGILPDVARNHVLGPAGSTVVLTIVREGVEAPFDVPVTRKSIIVPSVEYEILDGNIAYLRLRTFGERSTEEIITALEELLKENPSGLIFDLRNNSGGGLITSIEIASQFISEGVIVYEEYGDGKRDTYEARPGGLATEIPMVVLVNEWSASASELVAGALQDYGRAQIVGNTTFGKGTVQNWIALSDEQGAVRVTIAKWLTPNERNIHETGLAPDFVVELTEEDLLAGTDPQLDKALEVIQQVISAENSSSE
jgi:carboxyl-terminal processing protease